MTCKINAEINATIFEVTTSVGAGTVSDCWETTERGAAFSVLFVGQFFGPLVGPIIGGGLTTGLGWRSTFWFCAGYGVFLFCFLLVFLPETYRLDHVWATRVIEEKTEVTEEGYECRHQEQQEVQHEVQPPRHSSDASTIATHNSSSPRLSTDGGSRKSAPQRARLNPLKSLALLRHAFVILIALGAGICFGTMFTIETTIPNLYETYYDFKSWQTGMSPGSPLPFFYDSAH